MSEEKHGSSFPISTFQLETDPQNTQRDIPLGSIDQGSTLQFTDVQRVVGFVVVPLHERLDSIFERYLGLVFENFLSFLNV